MQFLVQLLSLLFLFLVLPDSFLATGRPHARKDVCHSPSVRVSWDQLDPAEKSSWTAAVKCLQTKPSVINIPGSKTLFDDFTVVHVFESGNIHFTAALVVWHAYFVHVREKHLKQCGYAGRTFFWNWMTPADGDDPWSDSIFDAETGLGGNGYKDTSRGMSSGPFMNFTVSKWAHRNKLFHRPHLVFSKWDQEKDEDDTKGRQAHKDSTGMAHWRNSKSVTKLLSSPDFNKFR
jgi:tyrosinase